MRGEGKERDRVGEKMRERMGIEKEGGKGENDGTERGRREGEEGLMERQREERDD